MNKKALITGITGQDGPYLAKLLLEKDYKVFGLLPRRSKQNFYNLNYLNIKDDVEYVIGDVTVYVMAERVQYYGAQGKLITESLKDYTKQTVKKEYASLDDFLKRWTSSEKKIAIINELREQGVLLEPLAEEVGKDFDAFDLICHVAFDQPPLTRHERIEKVKKRNYFSKYGDQARKVLEVLLDKYADTGIEQMEDIKILTVAPLSDLGTAVELVSSFGGKSGYIQAVRELERELYV